MNTFDQFTISKKKLVRNHNDAECICADVCAMGAGVESVVARFNKDGVSLGARVKAFFHIGSRRSRTSNNQPGPTPSRSAAPVQTSNPFPAANAEPSEPTVSSREPRVVSQESIKRLMEFYRQEDIYFNKTNMLAGNLDDADLKIVVKLRSNPHWITKPNTVISSGKPQTIQTNEALTLQVFSEKVKSGKISLDYTQCSDEDLATALKHFKEISYYLYLILQAEYTEESNYLEISRMNAQNSNAITTAMVQSQLNGRFAPPICAIPVNTQTKIKKNSEFTQKNIRDYGFKLLTYLQRHVLHIQYKRPGYFPDALSLENVREAYYNKRHLYFFELYQLIPAEI